MDTRLPSIKPTKDSPFNGDLMEREKPSEVLRKLVDIFKDGCVMGLNGKWGSGKTTFLAMWEQYMKNQGYKVIHFNSWENDDIEDPLIAIIAEFQKITGKGNPRWNSFVSKLGKISIAMLPSLLGLATELTTGVTISGKVMEKGGDKGAEIFSQAVDRYLEQKKSILEFKKELSEFVEENSGNKPIIFVIDELDRCNPKFAVKTLERIKHLFEVKNIVYVLAIDEEQLAYSIKGYYGSENFDAKDYLRRFIRISYDLPINGIKTLVNSLYESFEFSDLESKEKKNKNRFRDLPQFILALYYDRKMSIRQLEQYMLFLRIVLENMIDLDISPITISMLVLLKLLDDNFFKQYLSYQVDDSEIIKYIEEHFGNELMDGTSPVSLYSFLPSIADIMMIRYRPEDRQDSLINKDGSLKFKTSLFNLEQFPQCFSKIDYMMPGLDIIRERINILSGVNPNLLK